jgi:zinc transport system substrate-binding protein
VKKITVGLICFFSFFTGGFPRPLNFTAALAAKPTKRVVTSFYPVYIMAINVTRGVPGISVKNLAPPVTGCLHDYSLTAEDMKNLADAQLFVANGAGMESFLERVAGQYPALRIIRLADGVPLLKNGASGEPNPHVWVSVSGAIAEVKNLGAAMEAWDPTHAQLYRKNTDRYVGELKTLRARMRAELLPYRGREIITFHEAFPYLAEEFGLRVAAVLERDPGAEPSARELAETVDLVRKNNIQVLFSEPQYPALAAETIARETGAQVYCLDPAVTGPQDTEAYLRIMEKNLEVLKKALET